MGTKSPSLRLLSWNIHDGGSAKAIKWLGGRLTKPADRPDFVLLQEHNIPPTLNDIRAGLTKVLSDYVLSCTLHVTPISPKGFMRQIAIYRLKSSAWAWMTEATDPSLGYARGNITHDPTRITCRLVPVLLHHSHAVKTLAAMLGALMAAPTVRHVVIGDFNFERCVWSRRKNLLAAGYHHWIPALPPSLSPSSSAIGQLLISNNVPATYCNEDRLQQLDYLLLQPERGFRLLELSHRLDAETASDHFPIEAVIQVGAWPLVAGGPNDVGAPAQAS